MGEAKRKAKMLSRIEAIMGGTEGGKCSLCQMPFAHGAQTYGGVTREGSIALASECCRDKFAELFICGLFIHERSLGLGVPKGVPLKITSGDPPSKLADAAWFKEHTNRSHHMRRLFPDEIKELQESDTSPDCLEHTLVVVRQVEPGIRIRMTAPASVDIQDDDEIAHAIFDMMAEVNTGNLGLQIFTKEQIEARAKSYRTAALQ